MRPQGTSIIDLTWASEDICTKVTNWQVREDIESLSDYQYITMTLGMGPRSNQKIGKKQYPKWSWDKCDLDIYRAAITWEFTQLSVEETINPQELAKKIRKALQAACDASAPRVRTRPNVRSVFWWTEEIAQARKASLRARRSWMKARIKNRDNERIDELRRLYNQAKRELRNKISKAKATAWQELLKTIDSDPWGMPYKIIMKKLKSTRAGITETLKEEDFNKVLESLFPADVEVDTSIYWRNRGQIEIDWVYAAEIKAIISRKKNSNTAPGVDRIRMSALRNLSEREHAVFAHCFTRCLEEGCFPNEWKKALLVLIPKEWPLNPEHPKVRPICLLNETGKIFEMIIADRMTTWLDKNPSSQLSYYQFGFRRNRSTTDALIFVKSIIENATKEDSVFIAVSLDIRNAFGSLPWDVIREALRKKGFPDYLRRIIDDYLNNRSVEYIGEDGTIKTKRMQAGVPQGSVLGPLLWNIGYDSVLQEGVDPGCTIVCYADDTLIVATAKTTNQVIMRANMQVSRVLSRIAGLGLTVATQKTEAVYFPGKQKLKKTPTLDVGGELIEVKSSMKYLGVIIDRRMSFEDHFEYVEKRANQMSASLERLLPNLRGPKEIKRRLYANVVISVILYAAPVWSCELLASKKGRDKIDRLMRTINIRVIAGYRTVSLEASSILARIPPLHLQAGERTRIYYRVRDLKSLSDWSMGDVHKIEEEESLITRRQWALQLQRPVIAGSRTRDAILPSLNEWLDRMHGGATFHLTQILTGHGCLGRTSIASEKRVLPCARIVQMTDDAEHTLQKCEAWEVDREELRKMIGGDLRMATVVGAISRFKEAWKAVTKFANEVMEAKEECEREREAEREAESGADGPSPVPSPPSSPQTRKNSGTHLRMRGDDVPLS